MADQIKYYFKETTNQIFVSGSSTKSGMNTLLTSPKKNPTVNNNTTAKISSIGANLTYLVQNGVDDTTEITIADNQELWIYRGWQPANTLDANAYRYNPHLHRPYKAYMLTETGSGVPAFPWLVTGSNLYVNTPFNNGNILNVPSIFSEKTLGSNGNITTQEGVNSTSIFKGIFTVSGENRGVHPFVYTRYNRLISAPASGATITIKDSTQSIIATISQAQTAVSTNTTPKLYSSVNLPNGEYTYTSSVFDTNTTPSIGFTQFGLYCDYDFFAGYEAINQSGGTVRVTYTSSDADFTPVYFDLPDDKSVEYTALTGTPSFTPAAGFNNTIINPTATYTTAPQDIFSTRINDVYISYSSSLSESIDGLYIFNQIPQSDVQVTVSMFLKGWGGLDEGFKYGETNTTYSISPADPTYGGNGLGSGPTFPTASIMIYTGSYPSAVPTILDDYYVSESFKSAVMSAGLAVTMSTLIPKSSLSIKDCLSVSLRVSSGSANSASVENGLLVSEYELEFNTPPDDVVGDGRVPVFLENSFGNTDGFANAVDCQPLYNLIVTDETLRRNPLIQEVEYNIPDSFLLEANESLTPSQFPFADPSSETFVSYEYVNTLPIDKNTVGEFGLNDDTTQVNSTETQLNNRYYVDGVSGVANQRYITNFINVFQTAGNKEIKWEDASGNTLTFQVSTIQYIRGQFSAQNGYYKMGIINGIASGAASIFSNGDRGTVTFIYGQGLTVGANIIVSQVPLPGGTVQLTTTGTGTGLELDIVSINNGTELDIIVSSPGRGHKNGDILTVPQSVLTPIFGSGITRDLEVTLSFTYGLYNPSNFKSIQEGTAIKSTVPESFYTQRSNTLPRYLGSRSSANSVNSSDNVVGGFGRVPIIDYQTAYFAYCDQVIDLYPTINNKTLFNLKYLINEGGDALQPNLSEYTAFDVEGSWKEGGKSRVGINQISGSSQYDVLNNEQDVYLVTKLPTAYLWSQVGSGEYSNYIPLGGTSITIPSINDTFIQYGMNIAGSSYNSAANDNITATFENMIGQFPTSIVDTIADDYTVQYFDRYGLSGSNGTVYASSSITITSASASPAPGNPYSNPGEIYFNTDQIAINNDAAGDNAQPTGNELSDDYNFVLNGTVTVSPPSRYLTGGSGGRNDTRTYQGDQIGESVGYFYVQLLSTTDPLTSPDTATWSIEDISLIDNVVMRLNNGANSFIEVDLTAAYGTGGGIAKIVGLGGGLFPTLIVNICPYDIESAVGNGNIGVGQDDVRACSYAEINFSLKKNTSFEANTRYRFKLFEEMDNVAVKGRNRDGPGTDPQNNIFQPTKFPEYNQQPKGGELLDPQLSSPFFDLSIIGTQTPARAVTWDPLTDPNTFHAPYWKFSGSLANPGGFSYDYDTLVLQDPQGNALYATGDIMGDLPYTASYNPRFPGGKEPADSGFPFTPITWEINPPSPDGREFDEIRFENSENLSRKIIDVIPPANNFGKVKIVLDGVLPPSTNLDFFVLRRNVYSPNSLLINREFPYGSLPITKEFIPSTNNDLVYGSDNSTPGSPATAQDATGSFTTSQQSGSIVTTFKPLFKSDNTPAGILFPEFPTVLIDKNPDEVIIDLRDKKLIE